MGPWIFIFVSIVYIWHPNYSKENTLFNSFFSQLHLFFWRNYFWNFFMLWKHLKLITVFNIYEKHIITRIAQFLFHSFLVLKYIFWTILSSPSSPLELLSVGDCLPRLSGSDPASLNLMLQTVAGYQLLVCLENSAPKTELPFSEPAGSEHQTTWSMENDKHQWLSSATRKEPC